ncbi:CarD family transcriptional regulator [Ureibacillus chungkukjangi]|uniref:CarD family transcriptional regulator n=2 Tax=Ureibacillus chungkukjangi TaxID=1202712 RepID=A0A318TTV6_9BACL|nr:CarD family transcriptional regulator [Ureibacillus chungkukjangi]PYF08301.1 CarD family transcriptional regulator [Ureibacillus chungkukjangi]
MFSIGDKVFYGAHGVCIVQDIQKLTFSGKQKKYYILHSFHDVSIKLYHPVEAKDSKLSPITSKEAAEVILETFKNPPDDWPSRMNERTQHYQKVIESKNHVQIAQMINTILRKKFELEKEDKTLPNQDLLMLEQVTSLFSEELALSFNLTAKQVMKKIEEIILAN